MVARTLCAKQIDPSDVKRVTNVSGGDKGGDAFQFGSKIKIDFHGGRAPIFVQISVAEVICRNGTAELLEATIVPNLTKGLKNIATLPLQIYLDNENKVICKFGPPPVDLGRERLKTIERVRIFITGDLAFFVMALGRESMSGHWCYLCQLRRAQFASGEQAAIWTMEELFQAARK